MVLGGTGGCGLLRLVMGIEHWLFNLAVLPGRVVRIRWFLSG